MGDTAADTEEEGEARTQRAGAGTDTTEGGEEELEAKIAEIPQSTEAEKEQELRGVKVKWTQRVEEKPAHFKHTADTRKMKSIYVTDSDEEGFCRS